MSHSETGDREAKCSKRQLYKYIRCERENRERAGASLAGQKVVTQRRVEESYCALPSLKG